MLGVSEYPGVSRRKRDLACAWAAQDFDDPDPTGFAATILSVCLGGAAGIAIELWLYFRHDHPIRGMDREVYSFPVFLVLSRSSDLRRGIMVDVFRKRMAWTR